MNPHRAQQNRAKADAYQQRRRAHKVDAWNRREEIVAPIRAAGFEVRLMSEKSRHMRVMVPGFGWIDFWPSSGRWAATVRCSGETGQGVDSLIQTLGRINDGGTR